MSQYTYRRNRLTRGFLQIGRSLLPALLSLACAGVAHAQGTMDFSGAQTLMGTFKTFAIYAGAIICFGGLIFAGIRMMSGRFHFTSYDKEIGVRSGDLGTVTRIGQDYSMSVKLDSGKTAEVSPEKSRHIDYGYAVEGFKNVRAERVIATGDGLSQQNFQSVSAKTDLAVYTNQPQQDFSASKEIAMPELAQPAKQQHDFGIGF
jgi:hypothetical protein